MPSENTPHPEDLLDAYLDGTLPAADRQAFEARLQTNPALRREVDGQRQIDAALRAAYTPTVTPQAALEGAASVAHRPTRSKTTTWWRIAAMLALGLVGVWAIRAYLAPPVDHTPSPYQPRSIVQVYHDTVAAGFTPGWVCRTPEEFSSTFEKRLGQALALASPPASIQALGLSYAHSLSPQTTHLLATVNGEPVIVFVDRASHDPTRVPTEDQRDGLFLFEHRIGDLLLYELSPLNQPHLLERFYQPSAPNDKPAPPPSTSSGAKPCGGHVGPCRHGQTSDNTTLIY